MNDVTQILGQIEVGDLSAAEQLLPLVYEELRRLAAARMRMAEERSDHTLQATALVHEARLPIKLGLSLVARNSCLVADEYSDLHADVLLKPRRLARA